MQVLNRVSHQDSSYNETSPKVFFPANFNLGSAHQDYSAANMGGFDQNYLASNHHTESSGFSPLTKNVRCIRKCSQCQYTTDRPSHMRQHLLTHTREKPFACNFCDYKAAQAGNVRRHILSIHSDLTRQT